MIPINPFVAIDRGTGYDVTVVGISNEAGTLGFVVIPHASTYELKILESVDRCRSSKGAVNP